MRVSHPSALTAILRPIRGLGFGLALGIPLIFPGSALAAACGGDFHAFLDSFAREAAAQRVPGQVINAAFTGLTPDARVVQLDRRQGHFKQSFEQFGPPRVRARLAKGRRLMAQHAGLLGRIEQQFGVPGPVLIAIWGLETDFGAGTGKHPVIRAVATLAHDCRRTQMFQRELMAALQIVARGDLSVGQMRGAWAGEIGQTQFLPSSYLRFAVDFDGNGRRDLIRSVPDVLASTANYLRGYGWQRGGSWQEGSHNFNVLREWNRAEVYRRTIALFASELSRER
jgi:lytic murein transglycosylase